VSQLMESMNDSISGPSNLMFHPYLSGERTPHNDASAKASFLNITRSSTINDLVKSVVEGVSYAFADCIKVFENAGEKPKRLIAAGGGSQSGKWLEIISTVTSTPIDIPENSEHSAALGAARLGFLASNDNLDFNSILIQPKIKNSINPQLEKFDQYQDQINIWRDLYTSIKEKNDE